MLESRTVLVAQSAIKGIALKGCNTNLTCILVLVLGDTDSQESDKLGFYGALYISVNYTYVNLVCPSLFQTLIGP